MINAKDQYIVDIDYQIDGSTIDSLMMLYKPIIDYPSVNLYLSLYYSYNKDNTPANVAELIKDLNISIDQLETYRKVLEMTDLLKTMKGDGCYVFFLRRPLDTYRFLSNRLFYNMLVKEIGTEQVDKLIAESRYFGQVEAKDLKDVSYNPIIVPDDEDKVIKKPVSTVSNSGIFDIKKFLSSCSPLNFPIELRTDRNIDSIRYIGEISGVNEEDLKSLMGYVVDLGARTIDLDELKRRAFNLKASLKYDYQNKYENSPVVFLKNLQGFEPSFFDKRLLDELVRSYGFKYDLVNYLIEQTLKSNKNVLNNKYLISKAEEYKRNKTESLKQINVDQKPKENVTPAPVTSEDQESLEDVIARIEARRRDK